MVSETSFAIGLWSELYIETSFVIGWLTEWDGDAPRGIWNNLCYWFLFRTVYWNKLCYWLEMLHVVSETSFAIDLLWELYIEISFVIGWLTERDGNAPRGIWNNLCYWFMVRTVYWNKLCYWLTDRAGWRCSTWYLKRALLLVYGQNCILKQALLLVDWQSGMEMLHVVSETIFACYWFLFRTVYWNKLCYWLEMLHVVSETIFAIGFCSELYIETSFVIGWRCSTWYLKQALLLIYCQNCILK
jgi:hypothetical protein